jgi:hypothetical protein
LFLEIRKPFGTRDIVENDVYNWSSFYRLVKREHGRGRVRENVEQTEAGQ